jgi:beta-mannosidase
VARTPVPEELRPAPGSSKEFLVADADGLRAVHFPVPDKEFAYPPARYDVRVEDVPLPGGPDGSDGSDGPGREPDGPDRRGGAVDVVVTAHTLVRDLLLQADRLAPGAVADTGLLTLLPGEEARIRVTGRGLHPAASG